MLVFCQNALKELKSEFAEGPNVGEARLAEADLAAIIEGQSPRVRGADLRG